MNNGVGSILDSHKQQSEFDDITNSQDDTNDGQYQAFHASRNKKAEIMLEINFVNNISQQIHYYNINFHYKDSGLISILKPQEIIHIHGRNLNLLKEYFRKNTMQRIFEYDSSLNLEIPPNDKAFIEKIVIESLK